MGRKLCNRSLTQEEAAAKAAEHAVSEVRRVAKMALERCFAAASVAAIRKLPEEQRNENWKVGARIHGWIKMKGIRDTFIMLQSLVSGSPTPVILRLDHSRGDDCDGRLTYRQLHQQLRSHLQLEKKVSLRVWKYKPWHAYSIQAALQEDALPCNDEQCKSIWGTTLLYRQHD